MDSSQSDSGTPNLTVAPVAGLGIGTGNSDTSEVAVQDTGPRRWRIFHQCSDGQASNTLELDPVDASGRVGADDQPVEGSPQHTYAHVLPPSDQVFNSKDILPLILGYLKDSFTEPEDWKDAFTSIILINYDFFWAGVQILWHTMTSIGPALKLLPWHGGAVYKGLGTYPYVGGPVDWSRFLLYTQFIRKLELDIQPGSADFVDPHWLEELFFLPAMPLPFVRLNSITINPEVLASLPLLPLLINASLNSLDIMACDEDGSHEEGIDKRVQAYFPRIQCATQQLQHFRYRGPVAPSFFHRLTLLKSITSLDLEWVNTINGSDLLCLSDLPLLRKLHLATSEPIYPMNVGSRSPEGGMGWPALRVLKITGVEMMHATLSKYQHQHRLVEDVHLEVTRADKPTMIQAILSFYLGLYANLETIRVQVLPPGMQQEPWPASSAAVTHSHMCERSIENRARLSFAHASNITTATFEGVPSSLWLFMSHVLQDSIGGWKRLTSLTFRIQPTRLSTRPTNQATSGAATRTTFPGLSFLATTIWLECNSLEFLEFHFDSEKVMNEDLSQTIEKLHRTTASTSVHLKRHPLRSLIINTGTQEEDYRSTGVVFSPDRKIEVVAFLEQLFPRLTSDGLRGTPVALWGDMGTWLHTYRKLKVKAARL